MEQRDLEGREGQMPGSELCWGYFPAPKRPSRRWQLQREKSHTHTPAQPRAQGLRLGWLGCFLQTPIWGPDTRGPG